MAAKRKICIKTEALEALYNKYNRRCFISPDPLEFVHHYNNPRDMEIAGLIASCLAYGRVAQILKSVSSVLGRMGSPSDFVINSNSKQIKNAFADFKHRFTTGEDISCLISGIKYVLKKYGSLEECFTNGMYSGKEDAMQAVERFVSEIFKSNHCNPDHLLPLPSRGSACKRLNLFLRWMVRKDEVDPGVWKQVSPSVLLIPLDTHMFQICRELGLTDRRQADMKTVKEITNGFRKIIPGDPVKYDFSLTRLGILRRDTLHNFMNSESFEEVSVNA